MKVNMKLKKMKIKRDVIYVIRILAQVVIRISNNNKKNYKFHKQK